MRVGLFGGSFDPIHQGHIEPVETAREALGLEQVVYLPTATPPHKPERRFAPALARYAMVELALLEHPALRVSERELTLGRPAYTIETIEFLQQENPHVDYVLLVGLDSFLELPTWRRFGDLLEAVPIGVMTRPGFAMPSADAEKAMLAPELVRAIASGSVTFLENPPLAASSSAIRRRLAAGEPIPAGWLPEAVLTFVTKYSLYR